MVGDTAITIDSFMPDHTIQSRSFKGITKIIPVNKINAGLSIWGWTHVRPFNDISQGIPIDWWINDLLRERMAEYNSVDELALILEEELRNEIPEIKKKEFEFFKFGNGGIHLIALENNNGSLIPNFWHIHNGISQALPDKKLNPLEVNANHDSPILKSSEILRKKMIYYTVNGENVTFNKLIPSLLHFIDDRFKSENIICPIPNIMARAKFWRAIIELISNLYQVSGSLIKTKDYDIIFDYPASVGNEITMLTIEEKGITNYVTY